MHNKVILTREGIIEIQVVGPQTAASVDEMGAQLARLIAERAAKKQPSLILDNIVQLGQTDTGARNEVARLARNLTYKRLAMLGNGSTLMRVGTNLMLTAIGQRRKIKYFENRAKAMAWLLTD